MKIDISNYGYAFNYTYFKGFALITEITSRIYKNAFNVTDLSNISVCFDHSNNSPCVSQYKTIIYLNCEMGYYCQAAYQLCHELCHIMIKGKVNSKLRWLEESICECASLYFMQLISIEWKNQDFFPEYHVNFQKYVQNILSDTSKIKEFNISQLSQENSLVSIYLSNHEYDRDINRYMAIKLLPFFSKNPYLWKAFQNLYKVVNVDSIIETLHELKKFDNANLYSKTIDEITLFIKSETLIPS